MFANVFMLTVEQERLCTMELMTKNIELPMGELGIFIQELGPGEEGIGITTREVQLTVVVEVGLSRYGVSCACVYVRMYPRVVVVVFLRVQGCV